MALLELLNLSKAYEQPAVENITMTLDHGGILVLLGPSGCGKTTLLRLTAGLEQPDQGRVIFDGNDVTHLPPHKRQFGMMFQDFALFPHKNVFDNVAFGLRMLEYTPSRIQSRTEEMLALVGLTELSRRNVAALSGGEKQRVALARCLAPRPKLLMLDEPLGSLDRALRERLLLELRFILKDLGMTAIFVTHDQTEALAIADIIAVMDQGRVIQIDPPETLYRHPKTIFIAGFLGFQNLIPGKVTETGGIQTPLGIFFPSLRQKPARTKQVTLVLRPESARLEDSCIDNGQAFMVQGRVSTRLFTGQSYHIEMVSDGNLELSFDLPNENPPPGIGEEITIYLNPKAMGVIWSDENE